MKYSGLGVAKDCEESFRLFGMAAEKDVPEAVFNLADMIENGLGTAKNQEMAVELYEHAHKLRFVESTHRLGVLYYNGERVPKDISKAIKYWKEASDRGFSKSQYCLACAMIVSKGHLRRSSFCWPTQLRTDI
jgi:TPR repeat protein